MEWRMLSPLVLATMASQSLLVVLSPTLVAIADDLDTSIAVVGQARSITAAVSIVTSLVIIARGARTSVPALLASGSGTTLLGCAVVASAGGVTTFLLAHVVVGLGFALLLSGGFAGIAAFPGERRGWATGYVMAANAAAWILVNPVAAALTEHTTWRAAQAVPAAVAVAALLSARYAAHVLRTGPAPSLLTPLRDTNARRWLAAELAGYAAWTSLLTFSGAFVLERTDAGQTLTGWILAAAATAYVVAATRSGWMTDRVPRRQLVVLASLAMAVLLPVMLGFTRSVATAALTFCLIGFAAGVRTPASSALGLAQLPGQPAAMSAARTATTQVGYLLGALVGGLMIAGPGYGPMGGVLAAVMVTSAWLVRRVDDHERARR
jgi:predicted MFS family arabinose efflux permease